MLIKQSRFDNKGTQPKLRHSESEIALPIRISDLLYAFLDHLSQRLIDTHGPASSVRSQFSNVFSSETAWPIKAKFYVEPPWEGGTKVYINGPGHMTKMAAMPIYGKNL